MVVGITFLLVAISLLPFVLGFPRNVSSKTSLNSIDRMLKSQTSGRKRVRLYNLRRKTSEVQINDYNAALLLFWGANVDCQLVFNVIQQLLFCVKPENGLDLLVKTN